MGYCDENTASALVHSHGQGSIGGLSSGTRETQPSQPIMVRVNEALKRSTEIESDLERVADTIAGPRLMDAMSASVGSTDQPDPPLTRQIDRLIESLDRVGRSVHRITGAL